MLDTWVAQESFKSKVTPRTLIVEVVTRAMLLKWRVTCLMSVWWNIHNSVLDLLTLCLESLNHLVLDSRLLSMSFNTTVPLHKKVVICII